MNLTGNPFVDVGFGIVAARTGLPSIQSVSRDDLQRVINNLHQVVDTLRNFKILASFWVNNPFMGKNLGQKSKFVSFLQALQSGSLPTRAGYCQVCGRSPVTAEEADRCWFPLAAGKDSDPCTLPGLGGKVVCVDCMSAVIVLPLGCRFCPDGPYFVHVTEPDLQVQAAREGTEVLTAALAANSATGIDHGARLRERPALLEIASGSLLWDHTQPGHLTHIPQSGATMISFSNRGNGTCFNQLHLPAEALAFFGRIAEAGVRSVFLAWAHEIQSFAEGTRRRSLLDELCGEIEGRRSLGPFLLSLVRARKTGQLQKGERKVLEIYEDVALRRRERFDTLQRFADKIRQMPGTNSDAFIKRLGNLGSKGSLLDLVKDFCKKESAGLTITPRELRAITQGPPSETGSLLYLLCIAEEEGATE